MLVFTFDPRVACSRGYGIVLLCGAIAMVITRQMGGEEDEYHTTYPIQIYPPHICGGCGVRRTVSDLSWTRRRSSVRRMIEWRGQGRRTGSSDNERRCDRQLVHDDFKEK